MPKTVQLKKDGTYDAAPTYLFDHSELYGTNPHEAGLAWFNEAHYGLGVSFGLYSLLGLGKSSMKTGNFSPETYAGIAGRFKAEHFDAMDIVQFAIANGMRYVDFDVCSPDGFCLWNSQACDFNSTNTPARRDLLGELASVCEYEGIGICLTYSHGCNWKYRPAGNEGGDEALAEYMDYTERQIKELLTQYGPIAAVCLEGMDEALSIGPEKLNCSDLYKMINILQPQAIISYQHGLVGEEDFFSVPHRLPPEDSPEGQKGFVHKHKNKPLQIRETLTPGCWGYNPEHAGRHHREDFVWDCLAEAGRGHYNFLINTCLMPDGSLDLEDINTLLEVGKRIEEGGFPNVF